MSLEEKTHDYVMSRETMEHLGFNIWVQVFRLLAIAILYICVSMIKVSTPASHIDQEWLKDLFLILGGLFIFINCIFIIPLAMDAPHVLFLVVRVLFGSLIAIYHHIAKGFTLYEDLTPKQREEGKDSEILYPMRVTCLFLLCAFAVYLTISLVCMCIVGGIDGN